MALNKKNSRKISPFDEYLDALPSHQTAIDAIPGWTSAFPPELNLKAGHIPLFSDPRIQWCLEVFGSVEGRHVLELGPLEGAHTFMLETAGATVDAIEANKLAFLRCLVSKEVFNLKRSRFYLGNFEKWLERCETDYDLIVACGVLYHMKDPLHLLELIAQRTQGVFLWTHCMSDEGMPPADPRRKVFSDDVEERIFRGMKVRLYRRTYSTAPGNPHFCGGMYDEHRWIHRDDLLALLSFLGFDKVVVGHDDVHHVNGPAISILARR